jgi:RNA polymerase sigma-70 factor (ECF subfamily)
MTDTQNDLSSSLRGTWQRFLDVYEPLRPELYRYCRYLTRSPWDAEDLVQDTFARAFVTLGCMARQPPKPRAWLFRVASNLWIDRIRQARDVPLDAVGDVMSELDQHPEFPRKGTKAGWSPGPQGPGRRW